MIPEDTANDTATNAALSAGDHGHTISGSVTDSGSSGTDKNLGPWLALVWLVKYQ
jgi:hypothetical protein